ncbi:MAG TPA: SGNH/GDSL hydrolase family protein [Pseudonocardiaceae bacterium]
MRTVRRLWFVSALLAVAGALLVVLPSVLSGSEPEVAPPIPVNTEADVQFAGPPHAPTLAVVGASFAAGIGAGSPDHAWPADLGRLLHWRVVVSADPGAGFVARGDHDRGPFDRLAGALDLSKLNPGLVIVQGGHNDAGASQALIAQRMRALIETIRQQAPNAKIGVLSVFCDQQGPTRAQRESDATIVGAARRADPSVLIFDPLAGHWQFPRIHDHLHPTPAGHQDIANRLAAALGRAGVVNTTRLTGDTRSS